jgi:hypothetical protein
LVGENTILLSDYNATAYDKTLLDRAMILSQEGGGAQMESFRGSAKKGFQADFEEKVQDNFTAYGFIGQSGESQPNIPLIPNIVGGTCEDAILTLNGNTFISVPSGNTQDIELLDQNGDPITPDDVTGNVITVGIPTGGTNSAPLMKTGQTTSYRTGDDGDIQAGRDVDWYTLDFVNFFGHSWRFTGITGGYQDTSNVIRDKFGVITSSALAFPSDIVLDWSTYNSQTGEVLGYRRVSIGNFNRNNGIDACLVYSVGAFTSGWRMINKKELENIIRENQSQLLSNPPFNLSSTTLWTSTDRLAGFAYRFASANTTPYFVTSDLTLVTTTFPTRTFNISEL